MEAQSTNVNSGQFDGYLLSKTFFLSDLIISLERGDTDIKCYGHTIVSAKTCDTCNAIEDVSATDNTVITRYVFEGMRIWMRRFSKCRPWTVAAASPEPCWKCKFWIRVSGDGAPWSVLERALQVIVRTTRTLDAGVVAMLLVLRLVVLRSTPGTPPPTDCRVEVRKAGPTARQRWPSPQHLAPVGICWDRCCNYLGVWFSLLPTPTFFTPLRMWVPKVLSEKLPASTFPSHSLLPGLTPGRK